MKTALVVDDSRSARMVLSKLLAAHGIAADEAASAEAALDYLEQSRPDVVFLDHNMPGMDGFEALNAIKAKPETAAIPVMMYTSQEGQLYLSQARALGAIGVLPKSMQPKDVKGVLRSLHLIEAPEAAPDVRHDAPPPLTRQQLTQLIRELLYEHTAMLRRELRRQLEAARPAPPAAEAETPDVVEPRRGPPSAAMRVAAAANAATLVVALGFAYLYFTSASPSGDAGAPPAQAQTAAGPADASADTALGSVTVARQLPVWPAWRRQLSTHYAWGTTALDDVRALELGSLFGELKESGFTGTVFIDVHTGRYCMNYGSGGDLQLAPPEQPAATCEVIAEPGMQGTELATRQTAAFRSMVASATRDGQLRVEALAHGSSRPLIDYPLLDYSVTAGDWNSVAASNQRVSLRLAQAAAQALRVD